MQLTAYSDYALRVLLYLGAKGDASRGLASIDEIAASYRISRNHLMKVVHHLGKRGWIETVRGRGGGMRLAKPPREIGVGAVYRELEGFPLAPCFDGGKRACTLTGACALRDVLDEALAKFLETLDGYTLADLLEGSRSVPALLQIARRPAKRSAAKLVRRRRRA